MGTVLQSWVGDISLMQQSVLMTAVRGPDGVPKYGPTKMLLRWYRRCILLSAMDRRVLPNPMEDGGGSFTGPSIPRPHLWIAARNREEARKPSDEWRILGEGEELPVFPQNDPSDWPLVKLIADQEEEDGWEPLMHDVVGQYLRELDAIPHHFQLHLLHAIEILGFKHPDPRVRGWWAQTYKRLVHDMHLWPETEEQLDRRLGDDRAQWLERNDPATVE